MYLLKNLFRIILNPKNLWTAAFKLAHNYIILYYIILNTCCQVRYALHSCMTQHSPTQQKPQDSLKYKVLKTWRDVQVLSATGHCPEAGDDERNTLGCKPSRTLYKLSSKFSRSSTFSRFFSHLSWRSESCCVCCSCSISRSFRSIPHCWITCCSLTVCSSAELHLIISAHSSAWPATMSFTCIQPQKTVCLFQYSDPPGVKQVARSEWRTPYLWFVIAR